MSEGWLEGMVLAAVIADDRQGDRVTPGLAPGARRQFTEALDELGQLPTEQRRRRVRESTRALRQVPNDSEMSTSVARLLASEVPREQGRRWLAEAGPVRRGYRPPPGLKAVLRRAVGPTSEHAAAQELTAAQAIDVRFSPARAASLRGWAQKLAGGRPLERTLGALALGAIEAGAVEIGPFEPGKSGAADSRALRRIGAELARVWEATWRG